MRAVTCARMCNELSSVNLLPNSVDYLRQLEARRQGLLRASTLRNGSNGHFAHGINYPVDPRHKSMNKAAYQCSVSLGRHGVKGKEKKRLTEEWRGRPFLGICPRTYVGYSYR